MTYQYTAQQLVDLNQEAYRVNYEYPIYYSQPSTALQKGEKFYDSSTKQWFYTVNAEYGKGSGFKGLAVAPVINGKPDYSATAVIAAGTDSHLESGLPDIANAAEEMLTGTSGQEPVAESFVHSIKMRRRE